MSKTSCLRALVISGTVAISACATEVGEPSVNVGHKVAALKNATEGCSDDQIQVIEQALKESTFYAMSVNDDLGKVANGGDTSRFDYWFGSHDDHELKTVNYIFAGLLEYFDVATFVCGCPGAGPTIIGSTLPSDPELKIHLCDAYFKGDFEEVQVGALFHEGSHLVGTQDYIGGNCVEGDPYGWPETIHQDAQGSGASIAVENAESYRLYALDWAPGRQSTIRFSCDR